MPQRIVSLTPSLTEVVFALDSGHRVVGVTDSCDYPSKVKNLPNVTCWFDPDVEKLAALKPDLVLGLQTAHRNLTPELEARDIRFVLVNPLTVSGAVADIKKIAGILDVRGTAERLISDLRSRLSAIDAEVGKIAVSNRTSACRILDMENDRFHVAGPLSFQYDIISRAGGLNVTGGKKEAYPKVTLSRLQQWDPQVIFNCGFDLNAAAARVDEQVWQSLQAVRTGKVYSFDCALTCRTGPRIVDMVELLFKTLYSDR